jgi:hypothetical protein
MNEAAIRDRLVEHGKTLLNAPKEPIQFTRNTAADTLLNDLETYPHAFVLACVMDRQIRAEKAWLIPYLISQRLGGFSFETLARVSRTELTSFMAKPQKLHRFPEVMAGLFHSAVQRIANIIMATPHGFGQESHQAQK